MKYCDHCGAQIEEDAVFCLNCGCKVGSGKVAEMSDRDRKLTRAAEILMIIACAANVSLGIIAVILAIVGGAGGYYAFDVNESGGDAIAMGAYIAACITVAAAAILPLAYGIPMTVHVFKTERTGRPLSMTFKICALILMGVVPGILLLLRNEPESPDSAESDNSAKPEA